MKPVWYPGLFILYVLYIFPHEWGKKRNVVGTNRQWQQRHVLAPIYSILFYICIFFFLFFFLFSILSSERPSHQAASSETQSSTIVTANNGLAAETPPQRLVGEANIEASKKTSAQSDLVSAVPSERASPAVGQLDTGELLARYEAMVIEQEKASQYSGDDEVVRCRLGLPPQKLQERSEQALWKAMLEKANGDDRTAFSWMLEMYCSR